MGPKRRGKTKPKPTTQPQSKRTKNANTKNMSSSPAETNKEGVDNQIVETLTQESTIINTTSYATATQESITSLNIHETKIVELDTTYFADCYKVKDIKEAVIVHAVNTAFAFDDTKKLVCLSRDKTLWKVDTKTPELYEKIESLTHLGKNLAKVTVKTEKKIIDENGKVTMRRYKENDELLITLHLADTEEFADVTEEELYERIIAMGIGTIKKGLTQQPYNDSRLLNGNKFFVLRELKEGDKEKIPPFFPFSNNRRMYLNFRGKKRKCFFCSQFHDRTQCPLEQRIRLMEKERDELKKMHNNHLPIKTYSDSTLRHVSQNALGSDVDTMSGGAIGNIINAIHIDEGNRDIKNILIVGGQNKMNRKMAVDEYIWTLKKTFDRIGELAEERKIAILPPPPQKFFDAESQVKEELFLQSLEHLRKKDNIAIWDNPIDHYDGDDGRHPTREQTDVLLHYLDSKAQQYFGVPYTLPSASKETLTTDRYYQRVASLYKYGCVACDSKEQNKCYNLCLQCKTSVKNDESVQATLQIFNVRVQNIESIANPALPVEAPQETIRDRSPIKENVCENEQKTSRRTIMFKGASSKD